MNFNRIISESYLPEEDNSKHDYILYHSTYIKYKGKGSVERPKMHWLIFGFSVEER